MRAGWYALFALTATVLQQGAWAQTLTERLAAEDPVTLVDQAQRDGDIVRGAILFHQGNINCAQCHRPTATENRIGPDLRQIDRAETDEFIVESILQPSRQIKTGFETVIVLRWDGRVVSGLIVNEDAQRLLIRDRQDVDQLVDIRREDVDEIRPGKLSSMPENLVDQLNNRQQFLDLLRYVLDLKERGPEAQATTITTPRRALVRS